MCTAVYTLYTGTPQSPINYSHAYLWLVIQSLVPYNNTQPTFLSKWPFLRAASSLSPLMDWPLDLLPWVQEITFKFKVVNNIYIQGIPDDDTKSYLKSEVIYSLHEKSPGCFETKNTCSLLPSWNMSNCVKVCYDFSFSFFYQLMCLQKLGEEKELTEPFPMKVCYTKKNSNTFSSRT